MDAKSLRIVFMGTPDFAVASLKALVENGYNVVGVVTAPDKPAGRGKKITFPAVKTYALAKGLSILQPEKLKDPDFLSALRKWNPELQVVVAFRILPEEVWKLPRRGTFNLHGSILPQYRGAAPINRAIMNGEKETGVTTFLLDHSIDTGKILFSEKSPIGENDTAGEIHDRLMKTGAALVLKTIDKLAEGKWNPQNQKKGVGKETSLKKAPKIFREDCRIPWENNAESIRNFIRGLSPYPAAWTTFVHKKHGNQKEVKIYFAEKDSTKNPSQPGTIASDGKTFLKISCGDGWLKITDLQLAGKKRMKTENFLLGWNDPEAFRAE
jgi:methionyl-tRNA formyltransferase